MSCDLADPCALCLEASAHCGDPHVGKVCAECYCELVTVRAALEDIELVTGIEGCAEPRRSTP